MRPHTAVPPRTGLKARGNFSNGFGHHLQFTVFLPTEVKAVSLLGVRARNLIRASVHLKAEDLRHVRRRLRGRPEMRVGHEKEVWEGRPEVRAVHVALVLGPRIVQVSAFRAENLDGAHPLDVRLPHGQAGLTLAQHAGATAKIDTLLSKHIKS